MQTILVVIFIILTINMLYILKLINDDSNDSIARMFDMMLILGMWLFCLIALVVY